MDTLDILNKLCSAPGISGFEQQAADVFRELISPFCAEIESDPMGNLWGVKRGDGKKSVVIEAHADKIGLVVSHITDEGFVLFKTAGGFDPKLLPAATVTIYGKKPVGGVIGAPPPHIKKGDEKTVAGIDKLCIDTGYGRDELANLISIGDAIEINASFTSLMGSFIAAPACDDRAGLVSLVKCMEFLHGDKLSANVYALASAEEEAGLRGAGAAAYRIQPDIYLCVDVCHGKTPDASDNVFPMGGGVVITVGPNITRCLSDALIETAKEEGIPYQIDVDPGNTGTNAWAVQVARRGIATALLSIPVRYMHSCYEVINKEDILNCSRLLAAFIKKLS